MHINPEQDGVTHINVYSKGNTRLGRTLSNFAHTPFVCEDGTFASLEGYWYWLGCAEAPGREALRGVHGFAAKALGKRLRSSEPAPHQDPEGAFRARIIRALECKLRQTSTRGGLLHRNTLPLAHYYVYGAGPNPRVIDAGYGWLIAALERIIHTLQQEWNEAQAA